MNPSARSLMPIDLAPKVNVRLAIGADLHAELAALEAHALPGALDAVG